MSTFRDQLRALQTYPGVRAVVAAGRDGLLIDHAAGDGQGGAGAEAALAEHLAALAPGLVAAADMLADASQGGGLRSVVVEAAGNVVVALPISPEVTVLAAVDAEHQQAGETIGHLRGERAALARGV